MWLIDTRSLELEMFQECPAKTYAILSHTWGTQAEELNYDEFKAGNGKQKAGFEKIRLCCEQAQKDGLQYAWVDTCCIDKRSSTELSEAINSMYTWYSQAKICYVYLADVSHCDTIDPLTTVDRCQGFLESKWFTRGWTLQELLAPKDLTFYTREWTNLGDKAQLAESVHTVTKIDIDVLAQRRDFRDCSVAQRMSWASGRVTARLEDNAYCLIGLFEVNMPLLYGEGSKAFLRLQQEIVARTNDETIFAWDNVPAEGSGLLAPSAASFANAAVFQRGQGYRERAPYQSTNKGLSLECEMIPYEMNIYIIPLHCCREVRNGSFLQTAIFLCRTLNDDQYRRVPCSAGSTYDLTNLDLVKPHVREVFVPDEGRNLRLPPLSGLPLVHIRSNFETWHFEQIGREQEDVAAVLSNESQHHDLDVQPKQSSDMFQSPFSFETSSCIPRVATQIQFQRQDLEKGIIVACRRPDRSSDRFVTLIQFGFDIDFNPICIQYAKRPLPLTRSAFRTFYARFQKILFESTATYRIFDEPSCALIVCASLWTELTQRNMWCGWTSSLIYKRANRFFHRPQIPPIIRVEGKKFNGDDFQSLSVSSPSHSCRYVKTCFRPLNKYEFELNFTEKRRHEAGGAFSNKHFCTVCVYNWVVGWLAPRLSRYMVVCGSVYLIVSSSFSLLLTTTNMDPVPTVALTAAIFFLSCLPLVVPRVWHLIPSPPPYYQKSADETMLRS